MSLRDRIGRSPPAEQQRMLDEHRAALAAMREYRERTIGFRGRAVGIAFAAVLLLVVGGLVWLVVSGAISQGTADYLIPATILPLFFGGLFFILKWQHAKMAQQSATQPPAEEAMREHPPPPQASAKPSISLARAVRTAALARYAEPRRMGLWLTQRSVTQNETFFGLAFVGPAALGVIALSFSTLDDSKPLSDEDLKGLVGLWVFVIVGAGVTWALRQRRQARFKRRRQALGALAAMLSNREVLSHEGVVEWLNLNWAAPSADEDVHQGLAEWAVAGSLQRYPMLIDIEPDGRCDEYVSFPPRGLVYLAALVPDSFASSPAASKLGAALAAHDFALTCLPGAGLLARAEPLAMRALTANPPLPSTLGHVAQSLALAALQAELPTTAH